MDFLLLYHFETLELVANDILKVLVDDITTNMILRHLGIREFVRGRKMPRKGNFRYMFQLLPLGWSRYRIHIICLSSYFDVDSKCVRC